MAPGAASSDSRRSNPSENLTLHQGRERNIGLESPNASIDVPVIEEPAGDARNKTTSAISAGLIRVSRPTLICGPSDSHRPSVSTPPGQMQLTSMPWTFTSAAMLCVRLISPALLAR